MAVEYNEAVFHEARNSVKTEKDGKTGSYAKNWKTE